jgi:hypothetical protein
LTKTSILVNSSQRIPPKKSSQKILPKISPEKICIKNSPKKSKNIPKIFQDFESSQFPSSHLEAENPFGLVFFSFSNSP